MVQLNFITSMAHAEWNNTLQPCHFDNKKLEENCENILPIYMFEQILWSLLLVYAY